MTTMAIVKGRKAGNARKKVRPAVTEHPSKEFLEVAEMEKTQDVSTRLEVEVDGSYGQPHVEIQRSLNHEHGGWDEEDPVVVLVIEENERRFSGGPKEQIWAEIRASALDGLVRGLQQAITLARHYRLIPAALERGEILRLHDPEMYEALKKREELMRKQGEEETRND